MDVDRKWLELAAELENGAEPLKIYVVGSCDTGKTTFARFLARSLSEKHTTGYLDCDPGQSWLGPPTTLALSLSLGSPDRPYPEEEPADPARKVPNPVRLFFAGSTSPVHYMQRNLRGIHRCAHRALEAGTGRLIVDSSGLFDGNLAEVFQTKVLDSLEPHYIVLLTRGKSPPDFLTRFLERSGSKLVILPVSPSVVSRTPAERKRYRRSRFKEYLLGAAPRRLILTGEASLKSLRRLEAENTWRNLWIAVQDDEEFVLSLGIVEDIDLERPSVLAYAPEFEARRVASIEFGRVYLDRDGRELSPGAPA
jgi:polynucleotide 5'-hydroxyl-kinase GRC3/NOL9